ncbi:hypothetical protein IFR05_016811 [Cadophora sp. M221]|nr:hypothetical protein IFR05_016811 [Cadophora sp. M221]
MKSLAQHLLALVVLAAGILAAPLVKRDATTIQVQEQENAEGKRVEDVTTVEDTNGDEGDWVAPEGVNTACFVM